MTTYLTGASNPATRAIARSVSSSGVVSSFSNRVMVEVVQPARCASSVADKPLPNTRPQHSRARRTYCPRVSASLFMRLSYCIRAMHSEPTGPAPENWCLARTTSLLHGRN